LLETAAVEFASSTKPNNYNMPPKEQSVAIVGAGLSGLACALRLSNKKYGVSVFERSGRLGGRLWDIMAPEVFLREFELQFMNECYNFIPNSNVRDIESLLECHDAVYVATGKNGDNFGLLPRDIDGFPFVSSMPGVFIGGMLAGVGDTEALAHGLRAAWVIEAFLKTGNMKSARAASPTRMVLDKGALKYMAPVTPKSEGRFSREEAALESARCVKCRCDACFRHCGLLQYYDKFPKRLEEEVEATVNPGSLDGNGTVVTRFISTCSQCGLCAEVCPMDIDLGLFLRKSHQALREKGAMPWFFHEFWLRDMDFAESGRASLVALPRGHESVGYVFFPGCQLGASDPRYVLESYRYILSRRKDTAIALGCCGAPAIWAGETEKHAEQTGKIRAKLKELGSPKVILACPTCMQMYGEWLREIETVLLYDFMAECGVDAMSKSDGGAVSVFDPCSIRHRPESQDNIRKILTDAGYALCPLPYEGSDAQCCSWGGQIAPAAPNYSKWLVKNRIDEGDEPYVVYCSNCRDIFADAGKPVRHILDVIFNLRGWGDAPPTVSERRRNRERLKGELLREYWRETAVEADDMPKLTMSLEIRGKLDRARLLEEDILATIESCETNGRIIKDPLTLHRFGYSVIGNLTHWVEYLPSNDGYELINAYSHRMTIELEDIWNGRKTGG
jgi:Fe-S oxidoreductase